METQHSNTHIRQLAQKWLNGSITAEEAAEFAAWYHELNEDEAVFMPHEFAPDAEVHRKRIYNKIMGQIDTRKRRYSLTKAVAATAAAATIALLVGIGYRYMHNPAKPSAEYAYMVKAPVIGTDIATDYTRHLTLPDGSTVILKAGSTLHYPATFSGRTREVSLAGEAYFDIRHDEQHKFMIHTGKVTTTVLGTAFDITAWPNEQKVIVSVTRGRVKVEDDKNTLATLVRNEQINIHKETEGTEIKTVDAEACVKAWTKENMTFNHVTLSDVCRALSKRYGMEFIIDDSHTASAVTYLSFNGTEPLNNILEVICMIIPDTQYQIKDNKTITISTINEKKGDNMN